MKRVVIEQTKAGKYFTPFANQKDDKIFGYISLRSKDMVTKGGRSSIQSRFTLHQLDQETFDFLIEMNPDFKLEGRIVHMEYLESEVPESLKKRFKKVGSYEERIAEFVKRAGEKGPELTYGGERILRFKEWDESGLVKDTLIQYDNHDDMAIYQAKQKATASADLD